MKKQLIAAALAAASLCAAAQVPQTQAEREQIAKSLHFLSPGETGQLAGKALFKASAAYSFLDARDTDAFLKLNGNPPQGASVTISPRKGDWFGVLAFAPEGYVKDDEKIDADALLKGLKEQNQASNEAKKKAGYAPLTIVGWALPPRYDSDSKRLEWGTLLKDEHGQSVVNVSTRILGRSGYTAAVLVTTPETLEGDLLDFKTALKDFDYKPGEKYSEFRSGDKVAAYGLGALVLGGAAAAVASKGGFKVIGIAIMGALAALWGGVKKLFGRKS